MKSNEERNIATNKDFGIFSGLVTCAIFIPLFLGLSWGNTTFFKTPIPSTTIIQAALEVAAIGGFGTAALQFKSLLKMIPGTSDSYK